MICCIKLAVFRCPTVSPISAQTISGFPPTRPRFEKLRLCFGQAFPQTGTWARRTGHDRTENNHRTTFIVFIWKKWKKVFEIPAICWHFSHWPIHFLLRGSASLPWASAAPVTLFGSADAHDVSSHWLRQSDYVGGSSSFKLKPPRPKQRAFQVVGMSAFDEFCIIFGRPMIPFIFETNPAGTVPPLFLH